MVDTGVRRVTWRNADVARVFVLAFLFVFLWKFFWMVYSALFLGLLAVLIAILLHVPARFLSRWVPFRVVFPLVVLTFLGAVITLVVKLIPQILQQVPLLARQVPIALTAATGWLEKQTGGTGSGRLAAQINDQLGQFVGRFVPLAFNLIEVVVGSIAIFTLAVFFAAQPALYRNLMLRMVPPGGRDRARRIFDEAGRSLRNWVLGKSLSMALVGIFVFIGLSLFGVPGALVLGAFSAVMEFIPTVGPTAGAAPGVISAFLISPTTALYVAIFYFVLQHVQNAFTVPLVERRAVRIPPAMLLIWQLMLAVGFGILGLFVATPLLAVISVAVRILYLEPTEERYAWDRRETLLPGGLPAVEPALAPEMTDLPTD